ncbi:MAG: aminoglycoside phosphotransferase family protein [Tepidiformaceae bacterium]
MPPVPSPLLIPTNFAQSMREVYGEAGVDWLGRLPEIVRQCAERWSLTVAAPFDPLSYNWVAPATGSDGTPLVLKVGFPCREQRNEIEALRVYSGRGIAKLVDFDSEQGAMLLERLLPGVMLETVEDDAYATAIAANVMRTLWQPAPAHHTLPTVADWGKGFERLHTALGDGSGPFPADMLAEAEEAFAALLATSAAPVVLHGDLHHFNILSAERKPWLAIDPKGVVGEPAYEVGAFLRNPWPKLLSEVNPRAIVARRLDIFSVELGIDRQRLCGWAFAQAVLSAWWTWEDHGQVPEHSMAFAELLRGA